MNNLSKYMEMTMDELENEISATKKKVTVMQKLLEVEELLSKKASPEMQSR